MRCQNISDSRERERENNKNNKQINKVPRRAWRASNTQIIEISVCWFWLTFIIDTVLYLLWLSQHLKSESRSSIGTLTMASCTSWNHHGCQDLGRNTSFWVIESLSRIWKTTRAIHSCCFFTRLPEKHVTVPGYPPRGCGHPPENRGANWVGNFLPLIPQVASSDGLLSLRKKTGLSEFLQKIIDSYMIIYHNSYMFHLVVQDAHMRLCHLPWVKLPPWQAGSGQLDVVAERLQVVAGAVAKRHKVTGKTALRKGPSLAERESQITAII